MPVLPLPPKTVLEVWPEKLDQKKKGERKGGEKAESKAMSTQRWHPMHRKFKYSINNY
jgi:hypothetical protein